MKPPGSEPIPQACAIPYRRTNGRIEVCVVTSIKKRRWTFPKGLVEPHETERQAALKEAWEEAGLRGRIVGQSLGSYKQQKWGAEVRVTAYLMYVRECRGRWHEAHLRERRWLSIEEALVQLSRVEQRELLAAASRLLKQPRSKTG